MMSAGVFEMLIGNPFDVVILIWIIIERFPITKWIKALSPKITWGYSFDISFQVSDGN